MAVTDGCCTPDTKQYLDTPRVIVYDGTNWYVRLWTHDPAEQYQPGPPTVNGQTNPADGPYQATYSQGVDAERDHHPPQSQLDSLYSVMFVRSTGEAGIDGDQYSVLSFVATDAASPSSEPASRVIGRAGVPYQGTGESWFGTTMADAAVATDTDGGALNGLTPSADGNLTVEATRPTTSDVRLVSGDGDNLAAPQLYGLAQGLGPETAGFQPQGPDGVMDWAVGQFLADGPDHRQGQAAALTTTQAGGAPTVLSCPGHQLGVGCAVNSDPNASSASLPSRSLFWLPSYALNAFSMAGASGVGWAVGDKGAVLSLGQGSSSNEGPDSNVPQLGTPQPAGDSGQAAYDAYRPPTASVPPGVVPPISARPFDPGLGPAFVATGSADPTHPVNLNAPQDYPGAVVASRDGSEAWAIGTPNDPILSSTPILALSRYSGGHWARCDAIGIPGVRPADPACAQLAPLMSPKASVYGPVRLVAAARVPLENGSDPSQANRFEVIAAGTAYGGHGITIVRYRDGTWSIDRQATSEIDDPSLTPASEIAFTSPDDGWLIINGTGEPWVYHYNGRGWLQCTKANPGACDDNPSAPRLPLTTAAGPIRLAVVGRRVYLYGSRSAGGNTNGFIDPASYPLIVYRDPGGVWKGSVDGSDGGYDPDSAAAPDSAQQGGVVALSVAQDSAGRYQGWAMGKFGLNGNGELDSLDTARRLAGTRAVLMRLADGHWTPWTADDAAADYLFANQASNVSGGAEFAKLVTLARPLGGIEALATPGADMGLRPTGPVVGFDTTLGRWRALNVPFGRFYPDPSGPNPQEAKVPALAPDGRGGAWIAARRAFARDYEPGSFFYDFTGAVHEPVFSDVAHPAREEMTAAAGGGDGSLWVTTRSGVVYRYDRIAGWAREPIKGWDPGLTTSPSEADAVAIGPAGAGVVVGKGGRIADVSPAGVALDAAAGVTCSAHPELALAGPCGTGRTLRAAAVAPDGSTMVAGDARTVLFRPAGGQFYAVARPDAPPGTSITGLALPSSGQALLADDHGEVFEGTRAGSNWSWRLVDVTAAGDLLTKGHYGRPEPLRAIAVAGDGHGFAVGDRGTVLARDSSGAWQRLDVGVLDNLSGVALPTGGGPGALIGGWGGLVLTLVNGRFEVAQSADPYQGVFTGETDELAARTVGVALLPGSAPGQVEAWAASQVPGDSLNRSPPPGAIFHYSSDPAASLLDDGSGRVQPLPDSAPPRAGEVSFAAFGKSECRLPAPQACPEMAGTNRANELSVDRITSQLVGAAKAGTGPGFALYTGDISDSAGAGPSTNTPVDRDFPARRFDELIAQPLLRAGLTLFGALGGEDLSHTRACGGVGTTTLYNGCGGTAQAGVAASGGWRAAFTAMPAPWGASGSAAPAAAEGLSFAPVGSSGVEGPSASTPGASVPVPPASTPGETVSTPAGTTTVPGQSIGGTQSVYGQTVSAGGAHTHYAVDAVRAGKPVARLAVLDTSLKTLAAADATQNPVESQLAWLRSVLCVRGQDQTPADHCTRDPGEQAIVVSETPSYSYGPSSNGTLLDGTTFEALLEQYHVNLVVSGRLGWNGMYWTLAPGLHSPCPGSGAPDPAQAPTLSGYQPCGQGGGQAPGTGQAGGQAQLVAASLLSAAAPSPPGGCSGSGPNPTSTVPTVVSSSAGGKFAPDEPGPQSGPGSQVADLRANQGYWHGYTVIRLDASGDPRCTIVETRPVLDWVGVDGASHDLAPGQHETLYGYGREPVGTDQPAQYDAINSFAITHRYDLVEADPTQPWLPKTDPASAYPNHYVPLDPSVGTIDPTTGTVHTGTGNHHRTYAIGILSVGGMAASWPIAFEPRRNYTPPPRVIVPAPPVVPPIHVAAVAAAAPPPAPPALNPPQIGNPSFPALPGLPSLPSMATAPPPAPVPPSTPPPPPPPAFGGQAPLSLTAPLAQLSTPPSPIPPSAPVVNPAPPSGSAAKKEARQRQAATAKSEEGAGEAGSEGANIEVADRPSGLPGSAMTRHEHAYTRRDRARAQPSLTGVRVAGGQPSAWVRGLEWGGGLTLMALVLALGFTTVRPTPRGRRRESPAPAWARTRRRGG